MSSIERGSGTAMKPRSHMGFGKVVVAALVIGVALAIGWSVVKGLFHIAALGIEIAVVVVIVLLVLSLVGWFRVKVFKH